MAGDILDKLQSILGILNDIPASTPIFAIGHMNTVFPESTELKHLRFLHVDL